MAELRTVLRPIPSSDGILETGTVVDVSSWRTTSQLIRAGRLSEEVVKSKKILKVETTTAVIPQDKF
jgi:hypothetical protein